MKKKLNILILLVFIYLITITLANSNPIDLYVHNRPYKYPIYKISNKFYVNLEDILTTLRVKFTKISSCYYVMVNNYPDNSNLLKIKGIEAVLYINDKPIKQGLIQRGGNILIALSDLAKYIHGKFTYNKSTNIADLIIPKKLNFSSESSDKNKEKEKKEGKKKQKNPLSITSGAVQVDTITYSGVRTTATVKNVSEKYVKKITVTCQFLNGYNKIVGKDVKVIPQLAPKESKTLNFFWNNPQRFTTVKTKYILDWEGKKEQEAKK